MEGKNADEEMSTRVPIHNTSWRQHCKKCCVTSSDFMKIIDIIHTGIGIYYDSTRARKCDEMCKGKRTDEFSYILHNTGEHVIRPQGFKFDIESNIIKCPRCRSYLENAQKVLQNITHIERNSVLGICGYCKKRLERFNPCNRCTLAVQRFLEFKELEQKSVAFQDTLHKSHSEPIRYGKRFCLCGVGDDEDDQQNKTLSEQCIQRDITSDLCGRVEEVHDPEPEPKPEPMTKPDKKQIKINKAKPTVAKEPKEAKEPKNAKESKVREPSISMPFPMPSFPRIPRRRSSVPVEKPKKISKEIFTESTISTNVTEITQKTPVECEICDEAKTDSDVCVNIPLLCKRIVSHAIVGHKEIPVLSQHLLGENIDDGKKAIPDFASTNPKYQSKTSSKVDKNVETPKGIFRYALSDTSYIEKGWTLLPTENIVRQMYMYRVTPSHPEFDWFQHNKYKGEMSHDTGEKLASVNLTGHGQWFYKNGQVSLDYYDTEDMHYQQRVIVYSSGERDERGFSRPVTVLAIFDYLGNGVVFDHAGKIRLKYNQTEGIMLDKKLGPVTKWKWHSLNDSPNLKRIIQDAHLPVKDPEILRMTYDPRPKPVNMESENQMLDIEHENFMREKTRSFKKQDSRFKPFDIRFKAMKLNDQFSLHILDQATVNLTYREGKTNMKINLGMNLDNTRIIAATSADLGVVDVTFDHSSTIETIANLQKMVNDAKQYERIELDRKFRIRPVVPILSVDKMNAPKSVKAPVRCLGTGETRVCCDMYLRRKPTFIPCYRANSVYQ